MGKALKIASTEESELYVPRIQKLLEVADLRGARTLLAEAQEQGSTEPGLEKLERLLAPPTYKLAPARGVDRSAEIQWLSEHWREYRGQWVAVMGNNLLGHAQELRDLMSQLRTEAPEIPALLQYIEE